MYHLHMSTGSRGGGQSAKAKSDYITRQGKYENQEDKCIYTVSGNMPNFAEENPTEYWQAADNHERANGRLYTEVEVSLPVELSEGAQCVLARGFAQTLTAEKNLPYIVAVHQGYGDNPHAHIVISDRGNDGIERSPEQWFKRANKENPELGGAAKNREIKSPEWLKETRQTWAEKANQYLKAGGHEKRLDHRSLKEQGINRAPQEHIGPKAWNMSKNGIDTERTRNQYTPEKEQAVNRELKSVNQEIAAIQKQMERQEPRLERSRDRGLEL